MTDDNAAQHIALSEITLQANCASAFLDVSAGSARARDRPSDSAAVNDGRRLEQRHRRGWAPSGD